MDEMTSMEVRRLEQAVEQGASVRVYIVNGYQLNGVITDFDCNALMMRTNGREMMVYRSAVSSIEFLKI